MRDFRKVKLVPNYKLGDKVKVLKKEDDSFTSFPGIIIGFDDFNILPTIEVAYLKNEDETVEVCFLEFNDTAKGYDLCPMNEIDLKFSKSDVLHQFNRQIDATREAIRVLEQDRKYFESIFHKYFEEK